MKALALALAAVLVAAPVSAAFEDFRTKVGTILSDFGEPTTIIEAHQAGRATADALLPVLLESLPDECYSDAYVQAWLVYAGMRRLESASLDAISAVTEELVADTEELGHQLVVEVEC